MHLTLRMARKDKPEKPLKVDKKQFDNLLDRLTQADPTKRVDIETDGKLGKVIPPIPKR
jgi:hypothetical protein